MSNNLKKSPSELEEAVFAQVKLRTPVAENLRILSVQHRFLDGSLYTVGFTGMNETGDDIHYVNRAYVRKNNIEVFGFDDQLLAIVGATHGNSWGSLFSQPQFIASFIAAAMTIAAMSWVIVSIYKGQAVDVPAFLSNGFLIILGYYFGKSAGSSSE